MNFASRVRELRKQKKLTQAELGQLVGVHYTQVSRYERGISIPASDILGKLAEVLGVSTDYLLEGDTADKAGLNIHDQKLLYQFKQVEQLDNEDKHVIQVFLDAFLTKKQIQKLVN